MPTTVQITDVVHHADWIEVRWSDDTSLSFRDASEVAAFIAGTDDDADLTKKLCLAWFLARQPDMTPATIIEGKDFIFDLSNNNPINVR